MKIGFCAVVLIMAFQLTACETSPYQPKWRHQTNSLDQMESDDAECEARAATAVANAPDNINTTLTEMGIHNNCMKGKGYRFNS